MAVVALLLTAVSVVAEMHLSPLGPAFAFAESGSSRLSKRSWLSLARGISYTEEDLFNDDNYYGGRGKRGKIRKNVREEKTDPHDPYASKNEESAWEQLWDSRDTKTENGAPGSASKDFGSRTEESLETLVTSAVSLMDENAWKLEQLDAEMEQPWRRHQTELRNAVHAVSQNLVERSEESRLVVLGMVANEHILLLGAPGTGKSMLGRRLSTLCGGNFFQRLLTRFTTPDEIFGPLSLKALENDEYKRVTTGFLPTASVAFLDEIFRANSAILNTLLTILNERMFDNGGGIREKCPIRCVVGASNDLPEDEELDALYDRFLIRKEVMPVSDDGLAHLFSVTTAGEGKAPDLCVFSDGLDKISAELSVAAESIKVNHDICDILRKLRSFMRDEFDVEVSDRRLVQAARLLRLSAASHGRAHVDPIDCLLLQHIVWRLPEQRAAVREWLWQNLTPGGEGSDSDMLQFQFLMDGLKRGAEKIVRSTGGDLTGALGAKATDLGALESVKEEVSHVASTIKLRADSLSRHSELVRQAMSHCWLDPDEALAAQQLLLPKAERSLEAVNTALWRLHALELALSDNEACSPADDVRLAVIERLWDVTEEILSFSEVELDMSMKDAKAKYDGETFRAWKRARKKKSRMVD